MKMPGNCQPHRDRHMMLHTRLRSLYRILQQDLTVSQSSITYWRHIQIRRSIISRTSHKTTHSIKCIQRAIRRIAYSNSNRESRRLIRLIFQCHGITFHTFTISCPIFFHASASFCWCSGNLLFYIHILFRHFFRFFLIHFRNSRNWIYLFFILHRLYKRSMS